MTSELFGQTQFPANHSEQPEHFGVEPGWIAEDFLNQGPASSVWPCSVCQGVAQHAEDVVVVGPAIVSGGGHPGIIVEHVHAGRYGGRDQRLVEQDDAVNIVATANGLFAAMELAEAIAPLLRPTELFEEAFAAQFGSAGGQRFRAPGRSFRSEPADGTHIPPASARQRIRRHLYRHS